MINKYVYDNNYDDGDDNDDGGVHCSPVHAAPAYCQASPHTFSCKEVILIITTITIIIVNLVIIRITTYIQLHIRCRWSATTSSYAVFEILILDESISENTMNHCQPHKSYKITHLPLALHECDKKENVG